MTIILTLYRRWNARDWKTDDLHPNGAPAFLLAWQPESWPVDGGIPAPLIPPLARALAALGPLAFRQFWPPDPPAPSVCALPRPAQSPGRRLLDILTRRTSPALALATDQAGAAVFLRQGWAHEWQIGFLLAPGTRPESALLARLFGRRTWRDFAFPPMVRALIAAPTDGDGLFAAAGSEPALADLAAALAASLATAGFALTTDPAGA